MKSTFSIFSINTPFNIKICFYIIIIFPFMNIITGMKLRNKIHWLSIMLELDIKCVCITGKV